MSQQPRYFFTSDNHFKHANIIKHCNRPFSDVYEMNNVMIENWNSVITDRDIVYHLGDFSIDKDPSDIFYKLKGQKFLVKGNHDKGKTLSLPWAGVFDYKEIKIEGQLIILMHYSMRVWNGSHRGSWMLFGHSHGKLPPNGPSFDVGVDCHNYYPISFNQVKDKMNKLGY